MKIQIITVHDRLELIKYINIQEQCGSLKAHDKVLDAMYNNKPLIMNVSPFDIDKLNKICTFNIINFMKQNQFEFKPFDKVLVRNEDTHPWNVSFFSHMTNHMNYIYATTHGTYKQCIPYNEQTAHLIGTDAPYKPAEPKEYYVSWGADSEMEQTEYTADEFRRFIETAVINNKDVSNFMVRRIR